MSADLAVRGSSASLAPVTDQGWAQGLVAWAEAAQRAHEIATILCETSFVPKSMAHRPGEVTGAILTGMELGVPIMWALNNIDLIEGVPAIRAKGLRGLALRHGHEVWVEESTATRAVVCGRRKGTTLVQRSTWTMDRAKKAGLANKKTWLAYPNDMLLNRATAELVRLIAPDVLIGVSYTVDELGGEETPGGMAASDDAERPAPRPASKRRTAQRAPATGAALDAGTPALPADLPPEPSPEQSDSNPVSEAEAVATLEAAGFEVVDVIDTDDAQDDAPEPAVPMMTMPQRKRMAVAMRDAGIDTRDERLAFVAEAIGREVASSNELTLDEARTVIDALIRRGETIEQGLDRARAVADEESTHVDGIE